ncbi:MAG: hypothetical protein JW791_01455 [Nanoarchaeota archaeon]|nr:hypothetical protein [Nanoarchaeota archaeon]
MVLDWQINYDAAIQCITAQTHYYEIKYYIDKAVFELGEEAVNHPEVLITAAEFYMELPKYEDIPYNSFDDVLNGVLKKALEYSNTALKSRLSSNELKQLFLVRGQILNTQATKLEELLKEEGVFDTERVNLITSIYLEAKECFNRLEEEDNDYKHASIASLNLEEIEKSIAKLLSEYVRK